MSGVSQRPILQEIYNLAMQHICGSIVGQLLGLYADALCLAVNPVTLLEIQSSFSHR